jgi:hypothetical protein
MNPSNVTEAVEALRRMAAQRMEQAENDPDPCACRIVARTLSYAADLVERSASGRSDVHTQ